MTVRTVQIDGNPWFVAADVCRCLGLDYEKHGTGHYLARLLQDETNTLRLVVGKRGNPNVRVVSESGLYKLVLRSDKPEARAFQDWVTRVVLPAIRKDGGYVMGEEKVGIGEMDEDTLVLRAMEALQRKLARAAEEKARLQEENAGEFEICDVAGRLLATVPFPEVRGPP